MQASAAAELIYSAWVAPSSSARWKHFQVCFSASCPLKLRVRRRITLTSTGLLTASRSRFTRGFTLSGACQAKIRQKESLRYRVESRAFGGLGKTKKHSVPRQSNFRCRRGRPPTKKDETPLGLSFGVAHERVEEEEEQWGSFPFFCGYERKLAIWWWRWHHKDDETRRTDALDIRALA